MSKLKLAYNHHPGAFILGALALIIFIFGFAFSLIVFLATLSNGGLLSHEFCLSNSCVSYFFKQTGSVFLILSATGGVIVGLITFGGILIALSNYQNLVKTSTLTNHLSHMSIFSDYVYSETDKRPRLTKASIDVLKWYNYIYSDSRFGRLEVSPRYIEFIASINNGINTSNNLYIGPSLDKYEYKFHQGLMIDRMLNIGITLHRLPRLDFNEVEDQVLDLIYTINRSFCMPMDDIAFIERKYK